LHAQPRQQGEKPVSDEKAKQIAEMNDRFRMNFYVPCIVPRAVPGHIVCTAGIAALPPETQISIWAEVADFDDFTEDTIRTANTISARSTWRVPEKFSGRSTITPTNPVRPAPKILPIRPGRFAYSRSCPISSHRA
jgi:hypothetical protein